MTAPPVSLRQPPPPVLLITILHNKGKKLKTKGCTESFQKSADDVSSSCILCDNSQSDVIIQEQLDVLMETFFSSRTYLNPETGGRPRGNQAPSGDFRLLYIHSLSHQRSMNFADRSRGSAASSTRLQRKNCSNNTLTSLKIRRRVIEAEQSRSPVESCSLVCVSQRLKSGVSEPAAEERGHARGHGTNMAPPSIKEEAEQETQEVVSLLQGFTPETFTLHSAALH
ncbi:unnamed protein product [Pleuronectes platessa]|uniref:Uncharacterized protein n=1 Tax=Pleuronectes platessa TaxID=8262 RepID=A0A9N7TYR6_PLEPL|nr:unnamed protein product [Pleuronectes platessa]